MPKKKLKKTPKKTPKKTTPETKNSSVPKQNPQTAPVEEIRTISEEIPFEDALPDFEGEPGCKPTPKLLPEGEVDNVSVADPLEANFRGTLFKRSLPETPVYDPLPSFGEGPRRNPQFLDPNPALSEAKEVQKHARAEQENFWIKAVVAQNSKKPYGLLWLEAQREYQNRKIGPVQNWPPKISTLVEQKFRSLIEDPNFLRPLVRFQIRINNTPQVMPMTLYATYAATVEALRLVLEDNFDEI